MTSLPEHGPTAPSSGSWGLAQVRKLSAMQPKWRPKSLSYPAIVLAVMINILEAASIGLLVFPAGGVFEGLQAEGIAMFTASTLFSQIVLIMGGTNFSQAQGFMLIEVLPFMETMANKLAGEIPDDRTALLATVVTSYVLSSLVLGVLLLALGFFELDRWIAYFPNTVLIGALGAIGLSLFISGFQVTQRQTFEWSLSYFHKLFVTETMPVTVASLVLGILLCCLVRIKPRSGTTRPLWKSSWVRRIEWEVRKMCASSFLVPMVPLVSGLAFWAGALATGTSMETLEENHWTFTHIPAGTTLASRMHFYDFWRMFNIKIVRWRAIQSVLVEIVVLVVIGALNLPIYYPTLRDQLPNVPRTASIKREFLGHGVSNLLSGCCGCLPNIIAMSNTLFFARAGGDRPEAVVVLIITFFFFILSKLVQPYIPVLCAALVVFFFGIELMAEALVTTWRSKSALEYLVIMGTMATCTALGFAQGVGVGIAATLAALGFEHLADYEIRTCFLSVAQMAKEQVLSQRVYDKLCTQSTQGHLQIGVISLSGTAGYTSASKLRLAIHAMQMHGCSAMVIDLTHTVRIDLAAAAAIASERSNKQQDVPHPPAFLIGVPRFSPRYDILTRAGVTPARPNELDAFATADAMTYGAWPVSDFADVLGWLLSQASVSQPRLPTWALSAPGTHIEGPVYTDEYAGDAEIVRNSTRSVDIALHRLDMASAATPTIDPTLPPEAKWRACWDQLCCAVPSTAADDFSISAESDRVQGGADVGDLSYTLDAQAKDQQVWLESFVPVLQKYGRITFHEPRMLLSSASDPMPDVRILVVGTLEMRMEAPVTYVHGVTSSNPARKVDRTPADWLHSALDRSSHSRLRRRAEPSPAEHENGASERSVPTSRIERFSQGDVVGLSMFNFTDSVRGDLLTVGNLTHTTITIDFSAHDVRHVPELAYALNTYYAHNQFRIQRIQDIYGHGVNQGEQYVW